MGRDTNEIRIGSEAKRVEARGVEARGVEVRGAGARAVETLEAQKQSDGGQ